MAAARPDPLVGAGVRSEFQAAAQVRAVSSDVQHGGVPGLLLVLSAVANLVILRAEGCELERTQAIAFGPHLAVGLW